MQNKIPKRSAKQNRLYEIIFEAETRGGKLFDVALFAAIMLSVTATILNSVQSVHETYGVWLTGINWLFTLLFTVEYGLRLYCARNPVRYARSFFGVVDLLAVLPAYLSLFIPGTRFLDVIRILRMLRIFRVMKMVQYVNDGDLLLNALTASRRKIGIFLFTVLTLVVILGSLMYVIEGTEHGFTSIPVGIYWAIVTLTTVGYGDISPQTGLGQTLAAFIMIIGYSIIAVPTGIISAEVGASAVRKKLSKICPACNTSDHDPDAAHCKHCGATLA
ncbi:ion transporter [Tichowtungia aerotolerans]|uniref:Ion transporter n=1 Tax=Tichowtungia aerotolerans TaxID=2697043 RepID=A0A6P1MBB6_9BACT|nr:ion transporter [Tichowtungia aerotolerans]QHI68856.1 ion transporter [Tichowtungia aerotolerans]